MFRHHGCHGPSDMGRGGDGPFSRHDTRRTWGMIAAWARAAAAPACSNRATCGSWFSSCSAKSPRTAMRSSRRSRSASRAPMRRAPASSYPTLTLLEEQGFIAVVETEGPRKLYGLTEDGRAELDAQRTRRRPRVRADGRDAPAVRRRRRARDRAGDGQHEGRAAAADGQRRSPEDVSKITAILDAAARSIETL